MALHKYPTANREEWLSFRKKGVGGSDAAAIVGLNAYASPYSVWAEKTGRVPGFAGNLATEVGTYLEEFVAKKFEQETGKKVHRCNLTMINDDYPFALANVDRLVTGEDAGLEIKTTDSLNMKRFKGGEYPSNYYVQCMHYMAVTGRKRWYLAVLIGNKDFRIYTIDRDDDEIKSLMDAERDFWDCVTNDTPPAIDGNKATGEALGYVYAENPAEEVDLTPVAAQLRILENLKTQKKETELSIAAAENAVKSYMKNASKGTYGDYKVTWKEQSRSTFDKKALSKAHPEIDLDDFTKVSCSRVFRFN